ncbi:retrovirus-related Pol polyprotein from transposon 17.6 [Trichonephila clavipes]|nr:retrovirus-related Pol polyprotein from transposon 17.6 [Trichonephila clavipes]
MAEPSKHTSRLFLLDRKSGQKFLIDSGSEICVIPPSPTSSNEDCKSPLEFSLHVVPKSDSTRCKQALADAALLLILHLSAPLALHVDASDYAIGGALHQVVDSELQPLAFFSRKLTSSEKSYSAYDRKKSDKCSPRQIRQLDFISQFTTNIVHIPGSDNIAADVLSRVSAITFPSQIDYDCIAETQQTDQELHTLIASELPLNSKRSPLSSFQEPSQRFDHVHLDLIDLYLHQMATPIA